MLNIVVCDDSVSATKSLNQRVLKCLSNSDIAVKTFTSGKALLGALKQERLDIDILLMDIELGEQSSGIDVCEKILEILPDCNIIFISNYRKYFSQSYVVPHIWYILKSEIDNSFEKALKRAVDQCERQLSAKLPIIQNKTVTFVQIREILYCEQSLRKTRIVCRTKEFEYYARISQLEKELAPYMFLRCHKSFVVNVGKIVFYQKGELTLCNGDAIPIGRQYEKAVHSSLCQPLNLEEA